MFGAVRKLGLAAIAFIFPLYLWRELYPLTEWSVLALLPLAAMIFWTMQKNASTIYRAKLHVALRAGSPLSNLLTGRLSSGLLAFGFVAIALPVLSWQALSSTPVEITGISVLCLVAGATSIMSQAWLAHHLHPPFSRTTGMTIGAVVAAIVFVPILAWINWNFIEYPHEIRVLSLPEAMQFGMKELPARRGWIAELLAVFYAADAAKLWLILKYKSSIWPMVLFSLDAALVAFIVAKVFVVLTEFVSCITQKDNQQ